MEPDPIRQAYDDYVRKVGLREDPKYCSFVDFSAGAKWAALESAKLCDTVADQQGETSTPFVRGRHEAATRCSGEIRKHFGVEARE
jgi:hypothetical protein